MCHGRIHEVGFGVGVDDPNTLLSHFKKLAVFFLTFPEGRLGLFSFGNVPAHCNNPARFAIDIEYAGGIPGEQPQLAVGGNDLIFITVCRFAFEYTPDAFRYTLPLIFRKKGFKIIEMIVVIGFVGVILGTIAMLYVLVNSGISLKEMMIMRFILGR